MIIDFNPAALTAPISTTTDTYRTETNSPAIVVRVSGPNQTVADASGVTDTASGRPATPNQTFEIGSQTKMMTATIVLQLVAEGKINLDATAGTYLNAATKDGIANIDVASVRNLLNMKSGIADYTTVPGTTEGVPAYIQAVIDQPDSAFTEVEALDLIRSLPADGTPGQEFFYSNSNYTLLGQIIEQVTGKSFSQNLQDRIFDPAGMKNSTTDEVPSDANRLHQYITDLEGNVFDVTDSNWKKGAEGGVVSTTEDMTKFIKALLIDKTLLPPAQLAEMTTLNTVDTGTPELQSTFGLGLAAFKIDGIGWVTGFTGGTLGTDSSTYVDLATGRIISVGITNTEASSPLLARDLWLATKDLPFNPVVFNPASDVVAVSGSSAASAMVSGTNSVTLSIGDAAMTLPVARDSLTSKNVTFKDGSVLVIGSDKAGANDDGANLIDIAKQYSAALNKDNQLIGLGGNDVLNGGNGNDRIDGGDGKDTIRGSGGNDIIIDGAGNDNVSGGAGNDTFIAGAGNDRYDGGSGRDTIRFADASKAVNVNLTNGVATGVGTDGLKNIENVTGSAFADRITGNSDANTLMGLAGNDTISAGAGDDWISGGLGGDSFIGGSGRDVFDFDAADQTGATAETRDIIRDFRASFDRIDLAGIDAQTLADGNDAFNFIGSQSFQNVAGELRFSQVNLTGTSNDRTIVSADTDGDGKANFEIELSGLITLKSSDFIL